MWLYNRIMSNKHPPRKISAMQARFCREYIKDLNQTKAAERAGYAKKNARIQGSQLMSNPLVTSRIVELQKNIAKRHDLTPDGIILSLKNIRNKCFNMIDHDKIGPSYAVAAIRANELMGQHIGMWPKKLELSGNLNINEEKQAESQRKVSESLDRIAVIRANSGGETPRLVSGGKT